MPRRLYVQVGGAFSLRFGNRHGPQLLVPGQSRTASSAFWQEPAGVADFPQEAMAKKRAGWTGGRCSALHVPTQRAAMTDAARYDGLCTALHHRAGNGVGHRAAVRGGVSGSLACSAERVQRSRSECRKMGRSGVFRVK